MRNIFLSLLLTTLIYSSGAVAKRKVPFNEISSIQLTETTSLNSVGLAVKLALLDKNWSPTNNSDGALREIVATLHIQTHTLTVKIKYDLDSISFEYVDSTNLRYHEDEGKLYIHDAYYAWMKELTEVINEQLSQSDYLDDISDICFNKIVERTVALPTNHYALSRRRLASKLCSDEPIRILVSDKRPYVLNGDKKRSFVGLARFYGAPISVNAKGGIITAQIVAGGAKLVLEEAIPETLAWGISDDSSFEHIAHNLNIAEKVLLIEIKEWKVDSPSGFGRTAFYYDMNITIKSDIDGDVLATHSVKEKTIVKSNKLIEKNYSLAIESLFDHPEIRNALSTSTPTSKITPTDPVVQELTKAPIEQARSSDDLVISFNELKQIKEKNSAAQPEVIPIAKLNYSGKGKWVLSKDEDPITDELIVVAYLKSNEYKDSHSSRTAMIVRCDNRNVDIYVSFNDYLGSDSIRTISRIDKNKPETNNWLLSTNNQSAFYPKNDKELLRRLFQAKTFVVRATPYNENPKTLIFDVKGIHNNLKQYESTCGW